jgi:hypothetical protein
MVPGVTTKKAKKLDNKMLLVDNIIVNNKQCRVLSKTGKKKILTTHYLKQQ